MPSPDIVQSFQGHEKSLCILDALANIFPIQKVLIEVRMESLNSCEHTEKGLWAGILLKDLAGIGDSPVVFASGQASVLRHGVHVVRHCPPSLLRGLQQVPSVKFLFGLSQEHITDLPMVFSFTQSKASLDTYI